MENYRLWFMRGLRNGNRVAFGTAPAGLCVGVLLVLGFARTSFGDPTQFTLNTAQSTLKLTGQVASPLGPATLKPQVTGSDAATYSGFILADLSAGSIQFPGGSSLAANNFVGGALTPDNPANYGMKATIFISTANATVINLVFDLGSGALAVAPDGTFPANMGTSATVTSGIIDYVAPPPYGNGSDSLAGSTASNQAATSATLAIVGQTQTLTIPINATIPFTAISTNDSTAVFTGKLVATNTLTTPTVAYWRGDLDASWSTMQPTAATNWRKDAAGANETLGLPGATTDVFFTTSGGGSNLSTVLGASYSIKGLTFTSDAINPVSIGGTNTFTLGADGVTSQSGAATAAINCPVVLGTSQAWTANSSNPLSVTGSLLLGSATTLTKSGAGVVVLSGAQSFGNNSTVNVSGGTLRYNATANAASVGSSVSVHVTAGAEVELANSGSALSDGTHVANVTNDSQLPAGGLLVSGTNQRVGRIQGAGNVVVAGGGSLIANNILQNALQIAGSSGSHGLVTIAPSDAAGNPLVESASAPGATNNSIAGGVSGADGPFAVGLGNATNLLGLADSATSLGDSQFMQLESATAASPFAVPEPSGLLLMAIGLATLTAVISAKRVASRPFATSAGRPAV